MNRIGWRDPYPDAAELRRRIGEAMGVRCTIEKFAELVGTSRNSVIRWEHGGTVSLVFRARLIQLDKLVREGTFAVEDALKQAEEPRGPLVASTLAITLQGTHALLRFAISVPGEEASRLVAEILLPQVALELPLLAGLRRRA